MGASIEILGGFYEGLEVPVDRPRLVIGRGRSADLMIADPTLSRAHAAIVYADDRFSIEDLGSTNGTQVNDVVQIRAGLQDGDRIQIGKLQLRVRLPASHRSQERPWSG